MSQCQHDWGIFGVKRSNRQQSLYLDCAEVGAGGESRLGKIGTGETD